jgi:non-ribosomal peptide synthetase component E (peptide arylation enzyme)
MLRARLRDEAQNAKNHIAAVEVEVQNVWLNFPDVVSQSVVQTGVLQYKVDHCPAIVTTETRIRFQQLTRGHHTITIGLLGADNRLLAPTVKLPITVP